MRETRPKVKLLRRIPKPILAMATPPSDSPSVTIDRLKGGEINWSVKVPAPTLATAVTRAVVEAKRLMLEAFALEAVERAERANQKALEAVKAVDRAKAKEASQ